MSSPHSYSTCKGEDGEEISATVTKLCLLKSGGRKSLSLPYDLLEVMGLPSKHNVGLFCTV